jgi:hypothetical protein
MGLIKTKITRIRKMGFPVRFEMATHTPFSQRPASGRTHFTFSFDTLTIRVPQPGQNGSLCVALRPHLLQNSIFPFHS